MDDEANNRRVLVLKKEGRTEVLEGVGGDDGLSVGVGLLSSAPDNSRR